MKRMVVVIFIAGLAASVFGAPTYYTDTRTFSGNTGLLWDTALVGDQTFSWRHILPDYVIDSDMRSASMTINGRGILGDDVKVYVNELLVGPLTGDTTELIFSDEAIDALKHRNRCEATLTFTWNGWFNWIDTAYIDCSSMTVCYDPVPMPAVVPIPGAAGLGGIGVALVGWMRMRRQLPAS